MEAATATAGTLTINLTAVADNYRFLSGQIGHSQLAAAVKANAYGLGMAAIAPALAAAGCGFFYVAHLAEAVALRAVLPQVQIAVLHGIPAAEYKLAQEQKLYPVINDLGALAAWQSKARQHDEIAPILLHYDTGMNRLGLTVAEAAQLIAEPEQLAGLNILCLMSHLACADEPAHPLNRQQFKAFQQFATHFPTIPKSLANSSGIFLGTDYHYAQARSGCALYGINPTPAVPNPMQAVITLTAPVLQIRPLAPHDSVGYGASWRSDQSGKLAVLAVGYADGWLRSFSNHGRVYFGDYPAPIIGRVSMDLLTVDVSNVPEPLCAVGMQAELIGKHYSIDAVAAAAGTIGYEICTALGQRYQRIYNFKSEDERMERYC